MDLGGVDGPGQHFQAAPEFELFVGEQFPECAVTNVADYGQRRFDERVRLGDIGETGAVHTKDTTQLHRQSNLPRPPFRGTRITNRSRSASPSKAISIVIESRAQNGACGIGVTGMDNLTPAVDVDPRRRGLAPGRTAVRVSSRPGEQPAGDQAPGYPSVSQSRGRSVRPTARPTRECRSTLRTLNRPQGT